jgi:hypothetical protein
MVIGKNLEQLRKVIVIVMVIGKNLWRNKINTSVGNNRLQE